MGLPVTEQSPNLPRSATGVSGNSSYFSSLAIPLSKEPTPELRKHFTENHLTRLPNGHPLHQIRKSVSSDFSLRTDYVQEGFMPETVGIERTKNVRDINLIMVSRRALKLLEIAFRASETIQKFF